MPKRAAGKFRHRKRAASTWKLPQVVRPALAPWVAMASDLAWSMDRHGLVYGIHPALQQDVEALDQQVALKNHGLLVGRWNGKTLIPSHELAMSTLLHPELPFLDLELEDALRYLRKDEIRPAGKPAPGWTLVRYAGTTLGWVKVLADRINNYYPRAYRLRQAPPTTDNHGT
ncbi:MAG: hypothetical protein AAGB22_12095 [Bacteroidota bacterium]